MNQDNSQDRLEIKYIPLDQAVLLEINPKKHDMGSLTQSIQEHGFKDPPKWEPLLNDGSGGIVEGNGRIEALSILSAMGEKPPRGILINKENGEWLVPILFGVDAESEQAALAYSISHNVLTVSGGDFEISDILKLYDERDFVELALNLADEGHYALPFDGDDMDSLKAIQDSWLSESNEPEIEIEIEDHNSNTGDTSEVETENLPDSENIPVRVSQGEIWQVQANGLTHRVLCGDCRDFMNFFKLVGDRQINLAFTSPPYASQRKYDEGSGFKPIHPNDYLNWYKPIQLNLQKFLAKDGSYFLNIKEHTEEGQRSLYVKKLLLAHVESWHWIWLDEFCWERSGVPGSWKNRFKNAWEPVFHFSLTPDIKFRPKHVLSESKSEFTAVKGNANTTHWNMDGENKELEGALPSNVIKVNSLGVDNKVIGDKTLGHTAPFPVGLPSFFIKAFTDTSDWVFDPFGGSGSTSIAAHRNKRNSLQTEISPVYCDYILARLEKETGCQAKLVSE